MRFRVEEITKSLSHIQIKFWWCPFWLYYAGYNYNNNRVIVALFEKINTGSVDRSISIINGIKESLKETKNRNKPKYHYV